MEREFGKFGENERFFCPGKDNSLGRKEKTNKIWLEELDRQAIERTRELIGLEAENLAFVEEADVLEAGSADKSEEIDAEDPSENGFFLHVAEKRAEEMEPITGRELLEAYSNTVAYFDLYR